MAEKDLIQEIATVAKDILRPAYGGIMYPTDDVLAAKGGGRGLAIYDDLERDPFVYACMHKRKMAVVGRNWIVEPASDSRIDKNAADMVRRHLAALDFDTVCYNLLDAVLKGYAVGETMWVRDGNELRPAEVRSKNARRFTFSDESELRLLTFASPLLGEELPPRKFLVHQFGAKDGNPYGLGLGHKLWWPVFFKRQGLSFWLQFLDKFGAPTAVGKYTAGVNIAELETALARIAHDAGVALPEGAAVELLEAKRAGTGTHDTLTRYMDEQIAAAILTDGGGPGSGGDLAAAAILRNELRLELVKADADLLSGTLRRTLVQWIVDLNMPNAGVPRVWREVEEEEDLVQRATRDKTLFDMGFQPTLDYVRETYGGQWELKAAAATDASAAAVAPALPAAEFAQAGGTGTPEPAPGSPKAAGASAAAFFADQQALDDAIDALPPALLQKQMEQIINPLLDALEKADGYEAALALLASQYPNLPAAQLEKLLASAMFVSELWGAATENTD